MKNMFLLFLLLSISSLIFAQDIKVPEKAKSEFAKAFPKAAEVKWSKESANEFEVSFKDGNFECSASYDAKGKFLEAETGIPTVELPKAAADLIGKKYAGYQLTKAFKITDVKGNITFEAEITKGKEVKELLFNNSGKPIVKK